MITSTWIPLLTTAMIVIGGIFGALRFNRQDAKQIVETQSTVLLDMKALNTELSEATERIRLERDDLLRQIAVCAIEVKELQGRIASLEGQIVGLRQDLKEERS